MHGLPDRRACRCTQFRPIRAALILADRRWISSDSDTDREHPKCMAWDEQSMTVSRAFDEWRLTDRDIRAFLHLSTQWAARRYQEFWGQAEQEFSAVFNPDTHYGDEHVDMFDRKVGGLWPNDYDWMLRSAVVKDAVTAFEVYLEKSLDEALNRRGIELGRKKGRPSPDWNDLVRMHKLIGNDVETHRIKYIRSLRHMLTHQRGELRTEEMRTKYADGDAIRESRDQTGEELWDKAYVGDQVQLRLETVEAILDDLRQVARETDRRVWAIAWGNMPTPELDQLRARLQEDNT